MDFLQFSAEHSFKNDDYFYVFEDVNRSKRVRN